MAQIWHTPDLHEIEQQKHWELEGVEAGVRKVRDDLDNQRVADSELGTVLQQRAVPALITKIKAAQTEAANAIKAGGKRIAAAEAIVRNLRDEHAVLLRDIGV